FYPAGWVGEQESWIILFTTALLLVFVFLPVAVVSFFFAWRYRASNTSATYAPKWDHSNLLEVFLWGGPILIIIMVGYLSVHNIYRLDPYKVIAQQDKQPIEVEAISMDWKWLFIYPQYGVASVNELAMPVDTPVTLKMTSDTVMSAFMIPRMGTQIYVMSGMRTKVNLLPNKLSSDFSNGIWGKSFQYTGDGFSKEKFTVLSMKDDEFKNWVEKAKSTGSELDSARYAKLTVPRVDKDVTYFYPVEHGLFKSIIQDYHTGTPRNRMT